MRIYSPGKSYFCEHALLAWPGKWHTLQVRLRRNFSQFVSLFATTFDWVVAEGLGWFGFGHV